MNYTRKAMGKVYSVGKHVRLKFLQCFASSIHNIGKINIFSNYISFHLRQLFEIVILSVW